ncbi:MFS transporter [Dictyobacter kobayashii]|uniref:MFS transporter n=1 Tax=Dictyobacter kobayashii TaxID=2014872 RepID=A0A402AX08_9CHLR|nr:MFS transporter [Dictyobacter kobayashii]GCE23599.1 MFS transporter [Dictyobacter kobayashii]
MKDLSTKSARLSIGLSFYSFALVGLSVGIGGVILKSLSMYYHVGDAVLGTLFFVLYLSYSLSSFFCGPLAERLGLRWLLIIGTALFLFSMVGFILQVPFALLEISYVCMGLGTGIIETGFNIFISALPQRTSLLNYLHAFFVVGTIFGPLLATGILALHWGWNIIYVVLASLVLLQLGGTVFFLGVPAAEKGPSQEQASTQRPAFRGVLTRRLVWLSALFLLVYSGVEICAGSWGYTYLVDTHAFGSLAAGWIISGFGLGLTLGRFLIQPLAERKRVSVTTLMYILIGGAILSLLITWLIPFGILTGIGFCLLGLSLAPVYPMTIALVPKLVPERLVPSAIGVLVSVSISGLSVLPWLAGILAQFQGIWTLMPYLLLLVLILLAFWSYLAREIGVLAVTQKELIIASKEDAYK